MRGDEDILTPISLWPNESLMKKNTCF